MGFSQAERRWPASHGRGSYQEGNSNVSYAGSEEVLGCSSISLLDLADAYADFVLFFYMRIEDFWLTKVSHIFDKKAVFILIWKKYTKSR
jgi:hypothetical protein